MLGIPDVAIGAIAAAIIAGIISLLGLIISKEQKVSEFRQAWIDSLRTDVAALISHLNAIHSASTVNFANVTELWKDVRPDFLASNAAVARIKLRLNPKEEGSRAILSKIEELEKIFLPGNLPTHEVLNDLEQRLVGSTQLVLKQEWVRVRSGERVYKFSKIMSLVIIVVLLAIIVIITLKQVNIMGSS